MTEDFKSNNMGDMTDDDKLWSLLSFVIPIVGIVVLLMEDKKARPVIRYAAFHALALSVIATVVSFVLGIIPFVGCVSPFIFLGIWGYGAYIGYMIYSKGEVLAVPVVTDFIKGQGWI